MVLGGQVGDRLRAITWHSGHGCHYQNMSIIYGNGFHGMSTGMCSLCTVVCWHLKPIALDIFGPWTKLGCVVRQLIRLGLGLSNFSLKDDVNNLESCSRWHCSTAYHRSSSISLCLYIEAFEEYKLFSEDIKRFLPINNSWDSWTYIWEALLLSTILKFFFNALNLEK